MIDQCRRAYEAFRDVSSYRVSYTCEQYQYGRITETVEEKWYGGGCLCSAMEIPNREHMAYDVYDGDMAYRRMVTDSGTYWVKEESADDSVFPWPMNMTWDTFQAATLYAYESNADTEQITLYVPDLQMDWGTTGCYLVFEFNSAGRLTSLRRDFESKPWAGDYCLLEDTLTLWDMPESQILQEIEEVRAMIP